MRWIIEQEGSSWEVEVKEGPSGGKLVSVNDGPFFSASLVKGNGGRWSLHSGERNLCTGATVDARGVHLQQSGWGLSFAVKNARLSAAGLADGDGAGRVQTQMPGAIVKLLVAVGDSVSKGEAVIVVEAMKMENEFKAGMDGVVSEILVSEGQSVEAGTTLLLIQGESDEA